MQKKSWMPVVLCMVLMGLQISTLSQANAAALPATPLQTIGSSSQWIDLEGVQNARQLGGYPVQGGGMVRPNLLVRSGELAGMTKTDSTLLVSGYQLAHILDLRDEVEAEDTPDPGLEGVQYHHLNVWPREVRARIIAESTIGQRFDSALYVKNYYAAFALEPSAIQAYQRMFEVLLHNDTGSVLIHCAHGKDRTGVAAALILSALGVEWDIIEQEYLLSNIALEGSVDVSSLRHYRAVIEENYGSIQAYLETAMELDEHDLLTLREKYTTNDLSSE